MLGEDIYHLIQRSDNESDLLRVLEVGFPVDKRDTTGWTALHHAAHMGRKDCLATLLEHGADVNARTSREGQTALFLACRGGHLSCLQLLHRYHEWALAEAAEEGGGSDVPAGLDSSGADELEYGQWTPLHVAVEHSEVVCVRYLFMHNLVDINAVDVYDRTALQLQLDRRSSPTLAAWMVMHGARILSKSAAPDGWNSTGLAPNFIQRHFNPIIKQQDVCIEAEGRRLYAERAVLCERSSFFDSMFTSSMKESISGEVHLNSTYNVAYGILEWIYVGTISTANFDDILELWDDSHMYGMEDLRNYCQQRLLTLFETQSSALKDQTTAEYALQLFVNTEVKDKQYKYSPLNTICAIYLLGCLETVLSIHSGDPVKLVGRFYAAIDRHIYDQSFYPSYPELEGEIRFYRKFKHWPKSIKEVNQMWNEEEKRKGKNLLWLESSYWDNPEGCCEVLSQLRILQQLDERLQFFGEKKPHQFFDMISGTGLGALAALCLSKVRMSIIETQDMMRELIAEMGALSNTRSCISRLSSYVRSVIDLDKRYRARATQMVCQLVDRHWGQHSFKKFAIRSDGRSKFRLSELQDEGSYAQSPNQEERTAHVLILLRSTRDGEPLVLQLGDIFTLDEGTETTTLRNIAIATLTSAYPHHFEPLVSGDAMNGAVVGSPVGVQDFGHSVLLAEMQRVWPRWELKLLLSIGSDSRPSPPPEEALPTSASFASYVSRDAGKSIWIRACERLSDNGGDEATAASNVRSEVATVRSTQIWRLSTKAGAHESGKNIRRISTRDMLRRSISSLMMEERGPRILSNFFYNELDSTHDPDCRVERRWNFLYLHPADTTSAFAEDRISSSMGELIKRVKRSMRRMERDDVDSCSDDEDDTTAGHALSELQII